MKPIDIFDAMEGIPDQIIDAAKPSRLKHGESRKAAVKQVPEAKTAGSEQRRRNAAPDRRGGKEKIRMSTKQSVWQRITTGFVAAAACAVFVGSGWFIVQQAKQNRQQISDSESKAVRNFLGGLGTVHAAGSTKLMYDNDNVYFMDAVYQTARGGNETGTVQERKASDVLWDGEQFYRAEGSALYRIDMQGNHIGETPFYTIDMDAVQSQVGTEIADTIYCDVQKLADGYYSISYSVSTASEQTVSPNYKIFSSIYQPETGEQKAIPFDMLSAPKFVSDGKDIAIVESNGGISRVTPDPVEISSLGTIGTSYSAYTVANGCLYYLTDVTEQEYFKTMIRSDIQPDSSAYEKYSDTAHQFRYSKVSLTPSASDDAQTEDTPFAFTNPGNAEAEVILDNADFTHFIADHGKIYALTDGGAKLVCADPDWTNVEEICDFRSGMTDAFSSALQKAVKGDFSNAEILAVDENYILVSFAYQNPVFGYALIDRSTGEKHLYTLPDPADADAENTAQTTAAPQTTVQPAVTTAAATAQTTGTQQTTAQTSAAATAVTTASADWQNSSENIFGGTGDLFPVDWDEHGSIALYRDENDFYFYDTNGSGGQWYRCPLTGGEKEPVPARINGAPAPSEPFISDGKCVYTRDLTVVDDAGIYTPLNTAEVQNYLRTLNDSANNGMHYICDYIWNIKDRYFLTITGTDPAGNISIIEVWTDSTGRILSHEPAPADIQFYFCNAEQTEMYAIMNQELHVRTCPGDPIDDLPDPTAYGKIKDAYVSADSEFYYTADQGLYTRVNGQPVQLTERPLVRPNLTAGPDGRFFYIQMDPLNFSVREWLGGTQDNEIYMPKNCTDVRLCGFEWNGFRSYAIVLRAETDTGTSFLFVDPKTGYVIKEIR